MPIWYKLIVRLFGYAHLPSLFFIFRNLYTLLITCLLILTNSNTQISWPLNNEFSAWNFKPFFKHINGPQLRFLSVLTTWLFLDKYTSSSHVLMNLVVEGGWQPCAITGFSESGLWQKNKGRPFFLVWQNFTFFTLSHWLKRILTEKTKKKTSYNDSNEAIMVNVSIAK